METIVGLLQEPKVQDAIVEGIVYLLGLAGVGAVWVVRIRAVAKRLVPLLVMKAVTELVDDAEDGDPLEIDADAVVGAVAEAAKAVLPKGSSLAPLVGTMVKGAAFDSLVRISDGKSPVPAGKRPKGEVALTASMEKIGAEFVRAATDKVSVGAKAVYDLRNNAIDWGADLKVRF